MRRYKPPRLKRHCSECMRTTWYVYLPAEDKYACAGDAKQRREGCGHRVEMRDKPACQ